MQLFCFRREKLSCEGQERVVQETFKKHFCRLSKACVLTMSNCRLISLLKVMLLFVYTDVVLTRPNNSRGGDIYIGHRESASRFSRGTVLNTLKQSGTNILRGKKDATKM